MIYFFIIPMLGWRVTVTLVRALKNKQCIKKIILLVAGIVFILHPCFSATTQTTAHKKLQTAHKPLSQSKKKTHAAHQAKKKVPRAHQKHPAKKSKKRRNQLQSHTTAITASTHPAPVNSPNITKANLPGYLLTSIEKTLVDVVRKTIATLRYTAYKLGGTRIDTSRGIYVVDCSMYVDHVLKTVYPQAYTNLTHWSGSDKPTSDDYYHYFTSLSENSRSHWNTVDDVEQLRPGDILVFRYKNKIGNERGGHVMIVMDKPVPRANAFLIRVADAASTGHSTDTRLPHASGIGIGTLLLKVDSKTYRPYAYAWKVGSRWEKNVNFAMARPIDMG